MADICELSVMVDWNKIAPKGAFSASTMGAGDAEPAWLSWDIILNFKSPGLKAIETSKEEDKGKAMGILEGSGRAAICNVLRLPSLTSCKTRER